MTDRERELLLARIGELRGDASHIVTNAKDAEELVRKGDLQAACNTISVTHYKIGPLSGYWDGIMQAFEELGVTPGAKR